MSHDHDHENCDCEHHDNPEEGHKCPTESFMENLLKNLKEEMDANE